jgi:ADP-heptose:LPS heptosyltransferase
MIAPQDSSTPHVLVVRLDSMGDVLISGPAVRAVAAGASRVTMLVGPHGAAAATLLPGVDDVIVWDCPWIAADPSQITTADTAQIIGRIAGAHVDEALVLTSFHQSALPTALILRLAGVNRISAVSEDYPGALLDLRVPMPGDRSEPERMLEIAQAAGFALPAGDDGRLQVLRPSSEIELPFADYVVLHPGTSAPARAYPMTLWSQVVSRLTGLGWPVLVTGSLDEADLTATLAAAGQQPGSAHDLGGQLSLPQLAAVLSRSAVVIVANTGPAHLAAAVGAPIVSLFAPVVPASRWAPDTESIVLLGDQGAPCRGSRARNCPVPGHPCLASVDPADVVAAAQSISRTQARA